MLQTSRHKQVQGPYWLHYLCQSTCQPRLLDCDELEEQEEQEERAERANLEGKSEKQSARHLFGSPQREESPLSTRLTFNSMRQRKFLRVKTRKPREKMTQQGLDKYCLWLWKCIRACEVTGGKRLGYTPTANCPLKGISNIKRSLQLGALYGCLLGPARLSKHDDVGLGVINLAS